VTRDINFDKVFEQAHKIEVAEPSAELKACQVWEILEGLLFVTGFILKITKQSLPKGKTKKS
jgi:hypothetical protein